MQIKFIDLNNSLVEKVRELGIKAEHGDYFRNALDIPRHVLMTASNPQFSMGGGLDAKFADHFPYYCTIKRLKGGGNERIGNIIFAITVNNNYQATKDMVKKAIEFAIENTAENETLCLSGVGTGIGGLSEEDFIDVLKELIIK